VRQGNEELLGAVNAFLKEFREKGGFTELAERYMAAEKAAFDAMGVPFIFH
jgi:polar amino acid transport system substrate-binding protein